MAKDIQCAFFTDLDNFHFNKMKRKKKKKAPNGKTDNQDL